MKVSSRSPRRLAAGIAAVAGAVLLTAGPAHAIETEEGSRNCGIHIAYLQVRFNDLGGAIPPGGSAWVYPYADGLWHTIQVNGGYSGSWFASGDPDLDEANTFTGCRPYG